MGFTGSVSGLGGGAEGKRQGCHEGLKGLRLGEPGFDGFGRPVEEVWRIPHGPDGGNGNRSRTPLAVALSRVTKAHSARDQEGLRQLLVVKF
jgi:hypothetical protein